MPDALVMKHAPGGITEPVQVLHAWQYQVFGAEAFPGNPTTIHEICTLPADSALLAHSRTLATTDNAYYLPTAETGLFQVKCCSHTALLNICGHALLATGQHLLDARGLPELTLSTPAFKHCCKRDGVSTLLALPRFDAQQITDSLLVDKLLHATRLQPQQLTKALMLPLQVYVLIATSLTVLQDFEPAGFAWQDLNDLNPGALIISCALAGGTYAFRYFAPWWGKFEDSATGSAHSYLAPYWLQEGARVQTLQCSSAGMAEASVSLTADRVWIGGAVQAVAGSY